MEDPYSPMAVMGQENATGTVIKVAKSRPAAAATAVRSPLTPYSNVIHNRQTQSPSLSVNGVSSGSSRNRGNSMNSSNNNSGSANSHRNKSMITSVNRGTVRVVADDDDDNDGDNSNRFDDDDDGETMRTPHTAAHGSAVGQLKTRAAAVFSSLFSRPKSALAKDALAQHNGGERRMSTPTGTPIWSGMRSKKQQQQQPQQQTSQQQEAVGKELIERELTEKELVEAVSELDVEFEAKGGDEFDRTPVPKQQRQQEEQAKATEQQQHQQQQQQQQQQHQTQQQQPLPSKGKTITTAGPKLTRMAKDGAFAFPMSHKGKLSYTWQQSTTMQSCQAMERRREELQDLMSDKAGAEDGWFEFVVAKK